MESQSLEKSLEGLNYFVNKIGGNMEDPEMSEAPEAALFNSLIASIKDVIKVINNGNPDSNEAALNALRKTRREFVLFMKKTKELDAEKGKGGGDPMGDAMGMMFYIQVKEFLVSLEDHFLGL